MSATERPSGRNQREVAYRVFAGEFDDADLEHSPGDGERAPNYVVTPTGARINRLFVVGVLTEVEEVGGDVLRARVVDPTGAFVLYAGQYQPDAMGFLERASIPSFVAVTGKARTFQPDESARIFTSIRPESITEVDAETRDRWTVQAAEHTIDRVARFAAVLDRSERGEELEAVLGESGLDDGLAAGIPLALAHYGTTEAYLAAVRQLAIQAVEVVAGRRDEVESVSIQPDASGTVETDLAADADVLAIGRSGPPEPARAAATGPGSQAETGSTQMESGHEDAGDAAVIDNSSDDTDDLPPSAPSVTADTGPESDMDAPTEEMYEFDDGERAEIEAEFGTEFNTGTEVDDPGEAGIETTGPDAVDDSVSGGDRADEVEIEDDASTTPAADEDLEDVVVAVMRDLDDGEGADREAVISAVVDDLEVAPTAVEDAIQDALMSGTCYEPDDGVLKAI